MSKVVWGENTLKASKKDLDELNEKMLFWHMLAIFEDAFGLNEEEDNVN